MRAVVGVAATTLLVSAVACPTFIGGIDKLGHDEPVVLSNDASVTWTDNPSTQPAPAQCWRPTAPLSVGRVEPCASILRDGRVLVVDGYGYDSSAEIFDPADESWHSAATPGIVRQGFCSMVLLADGRVLMTGGIEGQYPSLIYPITAAEIYDPEANTWTQIRPMLAGRAKHKMVLLPDGDVLAVGTYMQPDKAGRMLVAERYHPSSDLWSAAEFVDQNQPLPFPSVAQLSDPRLLAVVTPSSRTVYIYNSAVDSWHGAGMRKGVADGFSGLFIMNGHLVAVQSYNGLRTELADLEGTNWVDGPAFIDPRSLGASVQLSDGAILVGGGQFTNVVGQNPGILATAELLRPGSQRWVSAGRRAHPWGAPLLVVLRDNRVLAIGGMNGETVSAARDVDILDVTDLRPDGGCD